MTGKVAIPLIVGHHDDHVGLVSVAVTGKYLAGQANKSAKCQESVFELCCHVDFKPCPPKKLLLG